MAFHTREQIPDKQVANLNKVRQVTDQLRVILSLTFLLVGMIAYPQAENPYWGSLTIGKYNSSFIRYYTGNTSGTFTDTCYRSGNILARSVIIDVSYRTTGNKGKNLIIKDHLTFKSGTKEYIGFDSALSQSQ